MPLVRLAVIVLAAVLLLPFTAYVASVGPCDVAGAVTASVGAIRVATFLDVWSGSEFVCACPRIVRRPVV